MWGHTKYISIVGLFPYVIADQRSLSLDEMRAAPAQTLSFVLQWTESRCKVNFNHLKQGPSKKNLYQFKCMLYRENSHFILNVEPPYPYALA